MSKLLQKETNNQKASMIVLQFASVAIVCELFKKDTYNHKDSMIIFQFASVAGSG